MAKTAEQARPHPLSLMEVRVNSGPWVEVENFGQDFDYETVRSGRGFSRPKKGWTHVDDQGHLHAFAPSDRPGDRLLTPTLVNKPRHVPCDGSCGDACEGYSIPEYHCLVCDEIVEPEYEYDGDEKQVLKGSWWTLRLTTIPGEGAASVQRWIDLSQGHGPVGVEMKATSPHQDEPVMHLFGFGYLSPLGPVEIVADRQGTRVKDVEIARAQLWPVA